MQAFNRRVEDLERHAVEVPEPPLRLQWPDMPEVSDADDEQLEVESGPLLTAESVTGEGRMAEAVSLSIAPGDRLLITGANGTGKSTLLDILTGRLDPSSGQVHRHPQARVELLSQEVPEWNAADTAARVFEDYSLRASLSGDLTLQDLGLLSLDDSMTPVHRLSQGQQRRLQLAMCLAVEPDVLILDEPTNHLSASLVDELTESFGTASAALVVVTHDRQMLADLSDWPRLDIGRATVPLDG